MSYILFYSVRCNNSNKMINLLQKYPEINSEFQKYAIESMNQFPPGLTHVPAIMERDTGRLFMSQQAFEWLENKVKNSFEASPDITSDGFSDFSFIQKDEKNFSGKFSSAAGDPNSGLNINPDDFDSQTGKPLHSAPISRDVDISVPQMTKQEFEQWNQQKNQQIGGGFNANIPIDQAMSQRQNMSWEPNNGGGGGGFQQGGGGQQGGGNGNPPLPPALQPISVSKSNNNGGSINLDRIMQQRTQEVPQAPQPQGGGGYSTF